MNKLLLILLLLTVRCANAQWVQLNNGMSGMVVKSLTKSGNNIIAGSLNLPPGATDHGGIWLSTNQENNWSHITLFNEHVWGLASNGNTAFAATSCGIYISSNNGLNWNVSSLNAGQFYAVAAKGNYVFAGGTSDLRISSDNGITWTTALDQGTCSFAIKGDTVVAGTGNFVFVSTNNGSTWTHTGVNIAATVWAVAFKENIIFAGTRGHVPAGIHGVYMSTNLGNNWIQTAFNYDLDVYTLAVKDNFVFAGIQDSYGTGVYVSSNNGESWTQRNQGFSSPYTGVCCLLIDSNYLYAGTYGWSVWRRSFYDITKMNDIGSSPIGYSLYQNYPNPFNPSTTIKFDLPKSSNVKLSVYDITGKEIETLVNETLNAGSYETKWDGSKYASGVYFICLSSNIYPAVTLRIVLQK